MRGVVVTVPATLTRVATIDDGFVEGVMTRLGVVRTLVGIASDSLQRTWSFSYPSGNGRSFSVADGMGTMRALHPWMADLPCASCGGSDAISYETIAAARPEVVILRVGDCTIGTSPEVVARTVDIVGAMGIPVVVLRSPADYRGQGVETLRRGDRRARPAVRTRARGDGALRRTERGGGDGADARAAKCRRLRGPACSIWGWRPAQGRRAARRTCGASTRTSRG